MNASYSKSYVLIVKFNSSEILIFIYENLVPYV